MYAVRTVRSPTPARAGEVFVASGNGKKSIILGMEKKSKKSQKKRKKRGKKRKWEEKKKKGKKKRKKGRKRENGR